MKTLEKFGIIMDDDSLLSEALTHSSYANEHGGFSYERLEFLGDAVLELIISDYIFNNDNLKEGEMSKKRSLYVCEKALFEYSKELDLKDYIKVGNSVAEPNKAIIADVLEAVIGAIYIEKGLDSTKDFIYKLIIPYIESGAEFVHDYKSALQEEVQTDKQSVTYEVVKEGGPANKKYYVVDVYIDGIKYGEGFGKSKKEAEQKAAKEAISKRA